MTGQAILRLDAAVSELTAILDGAEITPGEDEAPEQVLTMCKQARELGAEVQLLAAEIVRRAERSTGLAIRAGQAAGLIRRRGMRVADRRSYTRVRDGRAHEVSAEKPAAPPVPGPGQWATDEELSGNRAGIYQITDGVTAGEFEDALAEARAEQNLSRPNIIRHLRRGRAA